MGSTASKLRDMEEDQGQSHESKMFDVLLYARGGNRVIRYHTVQTLVSETVGHHSANVAMLCLLLSPTPPRAELLTAALTHDLTEQYTGDVPAPAKWASAELAEALGKFEDSMDMFVHKLTEGELHLLKQADMLDLCLKCKEEYLLGNTTIRTVILRGIDYLHRSGLNPVGRYIIKEIERVISK